MLLSQREATTDKAAEIDITQRLFGDMVILQATSIYMQTKGTTLNIVRQRAEHMI